MNTTQTTLPAGTAVNVAIDFEPSETGKVAGCEFVDGVLYYLIDLTCGYQEWFAGTDVSAA